MHKIGSVPGWLFERQGQKPLTAEDAKNTRKDREGMQLPNQCLIKIAAILFVQVPVAFNRRDTSKRFLVFLCALCEAFANFAVKGSSRRPGKDLYRSLYGLPRYIPMRSTDFIRIS